MAKICYKTYMTNPETAEPSEPSAFAGERIAKVLARSGVCSRREAETWIEAGRVHINGRRLDTPAFNVQAHDHITIDGKTLPEAPPTRLWRYHKPIGLVTTLRDPQERPTVFEQLPPDLPRVHSVGRLDINTEGLLLLTNDGALKRYLELPATAQLRRYRVRAYGVVESAQLDALKEGITIDGIEYRSITATLERRQGGNVWLSMALREGKSREIKRVLAALDLQVNRLIRLSFGDFQLGSLNVGEASEVLPSVVRQKFASKLNISA